MTKLPNPVCGRDYLARARRRNFLMAAGWWIVFGILGFLALVYLGSW